MIRSPCSILENELVVFAAAGSPRAWDGHNERAETWNVRRPAAYRHSGTGGRAVRTISPRDGYGSAPSKTGRGASAADCWCPDDNSLTCYSLQLNPGNSVLPRLEKTMKILRCPNRDCRPSEKAVSGKIIRFGFY